ncbi:RNA polymerase sigma factor [Sphingobacterium haloxyli]|uniref:RNA polymerase sigma-70 factor n=1 Tax=Sphingobacterium haloxyli TaxID=2100533 RepID=A0A2S9IYC5_9SPHI|nr:sigma-70 family RNA polymerase sigma factor [Sphingobacterium haloxyli]PRD45525.1 hypothetical protein C5745_18220 [Sphingobacterium haloxyli]
MTRSLLEHRFETLYAEQHRMLYAFVLKRTGSTYMAEEIVQATFIRWWELVSTGRSETMQSERALYLIAKGLLVDDHRKNLASQRLAEAYSNQIQQYAENDQRLSLADLQEVIRKAIDELPPRRQQIFQMSRFEDLTYQEIADRLDISIHTVESQMVKAIRELRRQIRPHIDENLSAAHLFVLSLIGLY